MCVVYSETLYNSKMLNDVIPLYRKKFRALLRKDKSITGIVSTGSSGAIIAGLLMMGEYKKELYHIHINKPNANSHKGKTSGWSTAGTFVFVDDFIDFGGSLKRCIDTLKDIKSSSEIKYALVDYCNGYEKDGITIIEVGHVG